MAASTYRDILWGEIPLNEPVLAELAESGPVQRLRGIHQAGASFYVVPGKRPTTRFEHSLGVLSVLASLGASLEEQVAGLLHDVPHTAFSHTADIVFPNDEHNFHERFQHSIIMGSAIPSILARHGVALEAATEPDNYPLLEQPLPDLCADRIDYALRDLHATGHIAVGEAHEFLLHLVPSLGGILVDNSDAALWFARKFRTGNDLLWTGPMEAGAYWALAGAIKRAYSLDAFTDNDLFSTDDTAMAKLRALDDAEVQAYLSLLKPSTEFYEVTDSGSFFATHMKQRYVDPPVLEKGWAEPRCLSSISGVYRDEMAAFSQARNVKYRLWSSAMPAIIAAKTASGEGYTASLAE